MADNPYDAPEIDSDSFTFKNSVVYFEDDLRSLANWAGYKFEYNYFQSILFSMKIYHLIGPNNKLEIRYRYLGRENTQIKTCIILITKSNSMQLFLDFYDNEQDFLKKFEKIKIEISTFFDENL